MAKGTSGKGLGAGPLKGTGPGLVGNLECELTHRAAQAPDGGHDDPSGKSHSLQGCSSGVGGPAWPILQAWSPSTGICCRIILCYLK